MRGKIIVVGPTENGVSKSGKQWRKQLYVLETEGQYPKKVAFNVMNDNIEKFAIQMGQTVEAEIDIESREYQGKWYTNNGTAWRVNNLGFVSYQQPFGQGAYPQPQQQPVYQQQAPQGYAPSVNPTNGYGQPADQPFPTNGGEAF